MGCDIHWIIEKNMGGHWLGLNSNQDYNSARIIGRNYELFSALASVRGYSERQPLGIPKNASELTKYIVDRWGGEETGDGHSHSYMSLQDFIDIFLKICGSHLKEFQKQYPCYEMFGIELEPEDYKDCRIVFFFDN